MSRRTYSDICDNVVKIAENGIPTGWLQVSEAEPFGEKSRLLGDGYIKIGEGVVYIIGRVDSDDDRGPTIFSMFDQPDPLEELVKDAADAVDGEFLFDVPPLAGLKYAGGRASVEEFLKDVGEVTSIFQIEETDTVSQSL